MLSSYTIIITYKKMRLGSIMFSDSAYNIFDGINEVIKIIENYNKRLASAGLPDELLVFYMLERARADGFSNDELYPVLEEASYEFIKHFYPSGHYPSEHSQLSNLGRIALCNKDLWAHIAESSAQITLDLDTKQILLSGWYKTISKDNYIKLFKMTEEEFDEIVFDVFPFSSVDEFAFNELEDILTFYKAHSSIDKCFKFNPSTSYVYALY